MFEIDMYCVLPVKSLDEHYPGSLSAPDKPERSAHPRIIAVMIAYPLPPPR